MAVEGARHILSGDHIRLDGETETVEVTATHHSPGEVRIDAMTCGSEVRQLVLLPDDAVMVSFYSDGWDDEEDSDAVS